MYTFLTDPLNPDTDGGYATDGEEAIAGTDPFDPTDDLADSDGDGMTDYWEEQEGADMFNPDTDGDGVLDGEEYDNGMDPTMTIPITTV